MNENGYVKFARKSINSDIWKKPPLYWKIWSYILFKANYSDSGNLKRGEAFFTIKELQEIGSYYIGYREIKPSVKQIRSIINYLREPSESLNEGHTKGAMIVTTKVTHGMLIKVLNYSKYQAFQNDEGNNESLTKDARRAFEGHNIKKNNKEEEKENNNILAKLVIDYLNQRTGRSFRYSQQSLKHIIARLNEGYSLNDCKKVVDIKCHDWKHDLKMQKYLNPETLFGSKFEKYFNQEVIDDFMTKPIPKQEKANTEQLKEINELIGRLKNE